MPADGCDVLLLGFEAQENLGLRSIAAFLHAHGIRTAIQPIHGVTKEQILCHARASNARIIGLSVIFQRMLDAYAGVVAYLRANGIDAHFTAGGHFPTFEPETTIQIAGVDSVIRHEGELTLLELVENIDRPERWHSIDGLAFRSNGGIAVNRPRALIENLDALPFPLRNPDGGITHPRDRCAIDRRQPWLLLALQLLQHHGVLPKRIGDIAAKPLARKRGGGDEEAA